MVHRCRADDVHLDPRRRGLSHHDGTVAALERREQRLEAEQTKLLQAHYADAVPLELLKSEQDRLKKALKALDAQRTKLEFESGIVERNLNQAIAFATSLTSTYFRADDKVKRAMNQAMFVKVFIDNDDKITVELREPFDVLLSNETSERSLRYVKAARSEPDALDRELQAMYSEWVAERQACLVGAAVGVEKAKTPQSKPRGLSIDLLVGAEGLEPPTPSV